MNVLDSSAWLEYALGSKIGAEFRPIVINVTELRVPTSTIYEVTKKLLLTTSEENAQKVAFQMQSGHVVPLSSEISIAAASMAITHNLPMADSIIYTTSMIYDAELWTTDSHFENLPGVRYFAKQA
jgi:predicted nucleic acid-binding protein